MEKDTEKSELEKTREYAKNEWRKFHPEEEKKNANCEKQNANEARTDILMFFIVLIALVILGVWIAEFANADIPVFILVFFSIFLRELFKVYINEQEPYKDGEKGRTLEIIIYVFGIVECGVLSIVAFCIGGNDFYTNDIEIAAALNLILPPLIRL